MWKVRRAGTANPWSVYLYLLFIIFRYILITHTLPLSIFKRFPGRHLQAANTNPVIPVIKMDPRGLTKAMQLSSHWKWPGRQAATVIRNILFTEQLIWKAVPYVIYEIHIFSFNSKQFVIESSWEVTHDRLKCDGFIWHWNTCSAFCQSVGTDK